MRADLDSMYTQFMRGIDVSLFPVPADMRGMTLGDLERSWAGSIAATARAISKQKFTLAHPARDEAEVVAAAKR
jgi:hypothetical protein